MNDITTLQKALITIKKLKQLLQEQKTRAVEPIAIVGMSCRLPQANNHHEFWQLLCQEKNIITPLSEERWSLLQGTNEISQRDPHSTYAGGYLKNISDFDAYFFAISPREALRMDPQQRLLLEVSYESFEDAGLTIEELAGSNTGVFSSLYASQFAHLQELESDMDALFLPTGNALSMAANRLSYLFDLHGPSIVLDTACSSSLIAIHLACLHLQTKLCDQAIVNAANINLLPSIHSVLAKATMLSPTGQCHTFDVAADGYVQGEGMGSIILKPLSKALRDKNKIYAVIAGSAINQDGKTNGLTAPNGLQQKALLLSAYQAAHIDPAHVSYIECHGTGTFLGDPIEIQALGEVVSKQREPQHPCWIGSVKTNIGHLEPAAGIMSVIKVALALKHGIIPSHLNFFTPNPHLALDKYHLAVATSATAWPNYADYRIAGISGFGFGGANAHLVLRELTPAEQIADPESLSANPAEIFILSAKDATALRALVERWIDYLIANPAVSLAQICYNLHVKRSHYSHRLAIVTQSIDDLKQKLSAIHNNPRTTEINIFTQQYEPKKPNNKPIDFDLTILATQYIDNTTIDWKQFETNRSYAVMDMPLYPWQHKKYWPTLKSTKNEINTTSYLLYGKPIASPLPTKQFEFMFDTKTLPEIKDSFYVLHAGYYLEMLAYAINQSYEKTNFSLRNFEYLSPLLVMDGEKVYVQAVFEKFDDEMLFFTFYSSRDQKKNWISHARGSLTLTATQQHNIDSRTSIINRSISSGTEEKFYKRVTDMGMPAGDTIRWIQEYWLGNNEILCELRKPKKSERGENFTLKMHVGIIDACIQTLFLMLPAEMMKPYVASNMEKLEFYGKQDDAMYIYSVLKDIQANGEKLVGDWYLLDKDHHLIAKCENVTMTQLNNTMQIDKIMELQAIYKIDKSLSYEEIKNNLIHYLIEQFANVFAMPKEDIDSNQSLQALGMDSLMALAVVRIIDTGLGVTYSLPQLMRGPTIHEIAEHVLFTQQIHYSQEIKPTEIKMENNWIAYRKNKPAAQARVFCFPYGGGGASIYRDWQHEFSDVIEVCPIQLPGRENRMDEKPINDINALITLIAENIKTKLDLPFVFFGHSFGSLLAFELTRYLRRNQLPLPLHLFLSAYPDPRIPSKSLDNLLNQLKQMDIHLFDLNQDVISRLTDEQFNMLSIIFKDNGIVDYSDQRMNKDIIKILLPIFIGDMNIVRTYHYYDEPSLALSATVFLGEQDTWVSPADHAGWSTHFSNSCDFQRFNSGHLFIRENKIRSKIIHKIQGTVINYAVEAV